MQRGQALAQRRSPAIRRSNPRAGEWDSGTASRDAALGTPKKRLPSPALISPVVRKQQNRPPHTHTQGLHVMARGYREDEAERQRYDWLAPFSRLGSLRLQVKRAGRQAAARRRAPGR